MSWLKPVEVCEPLIIITSFLAYHCYVIGALVSCTVSTPSTMPSRSDQLPATIAAICMAVLLVMAIVALVIVIVWKYIPQKELSKLKYV